MPKIDDNAYNEAQVSTGESVKMPAGGYVVRIQAVRTHGEDSNHRPVNYVSEKLYVKLIYDIAEGDFAGKYSEDYWQGEDKDYAHCLYLSWKNLGVLKNFVTCFDESNPGFDSKAAFDADQWGLYIGKYIGIVLGEEEYIGNDGSVKTRYTMPRIKSVPDIRAGKFRVPELKKLKESATPTQDNAVPVDVYDDIPFSV